MVLIASAIVQIVAAPTTNIVDSVKEKYPCYSGVSEWIVAPRNGTPYSSPQAPCLRREFEIPGDIATARLAMTALGIYEAKIERAYGCAAIR